MAFFTALAAKIVLPGIVKRAGGFVAIPLKWMIADWRHIAIVLLTVAVLHLNFCQLSRAYSKGRADLEAELAAVAKLAAEKQLTREAQAETRATADLAKGAASDAADARALTDATKGMSDAPLSDRRRAAICQRMQNDARSRGAASPACPDLRPR